MTRVMRDSTNPGDIPVAGTQLAAGYVNGAISQWPSNGWDRFPGAAKVTIDVNGSMPQADCLDIENGDASIATAVQWVRDKRLSYIGYPPVLYCNRSTLTPLFNALNAAGFHVVHDFRLWIATLDGVTKTVPDMTGVTAVQWAGADHTGGHYDESIVYDDSWKAALVPPPSVTDTAILVELPNGTTRTVHSSDGTHWS